MTEDNKTRKQIAEDASVRILCPWCKADITDYEEGSLADTKHMVAECCIGESE